MPEGNQVSVLVSESSGMYCDLLHKAFYAVRNRFKIVASVDSTAEILTALQEHRPQVAVVSCELKDGPLAGMRLLPVIRIADPNIKILLMMGSSYRELVIDAFRSGADGVFSRNSPFDLMCKAIEVVSRGQIWATSEELHCVLRAFVKSPKLPKPDPTIETRLTMREAAVVRLAIEGLSNREIAQHLTLTEHTVKNYLFRVFDKLGVSNRVELVLSSLHQEALVSEVLAPEKGIPPRRVLPAGKTKSPVARG